MKLTIGGGDCPHTRLVIGVVMRIVRRLQYKSSAGVIRIHLDLTRTVTSITYNWCNWGWTRKWTGMMSKEWWRNFWQWARRWAGRWRCSHCYSWRGRRNTRWRWWARSCCEDEVHYRCLTDRFLDFHIIAGDLGGLRLKGQIKVQLDHLGSNLGDELKILWQLPQLLRRGGRQRVVVQRPAAEVQVRDAGVGARHGDHHVAEDNGACHLVVEWRSLNSLCTTLERTKYNFYTEIQVLNIP